MKNVPQEIKTITFPFVLNVSVNCYLIRNGDGFILIDTARAKNRTALEKEMESAGCLPGNLKLIVLTHGDFDHCGNAAYLRQKYASRIAMHQDDFGMVERGDMMWNRRKPNVLVKALMGLLMRLDEADRFKPDICLAEGDNLTQYGLDAEVVYLPGHSKGSIGILTADGDLFCGDLLANTNKPDIWSIKDDAAAMNVSVEKLKSLRINTVYPGHGKSFLMEQFMKNQR
jgi:glyoxylase-like metal-dependent hydrolase (beta-lactamase superfamily II)